MVVGAAAVEAGWSGAGTGDDAGLEGAGLRSGGEPWEEDGDAGWSAVLPRRRVFGAGREAVPGGDQGPARHF